MLGKESDEKSPGIDLAVGREMPTWKRVLMVILSPFVLPGVLFVLFFGAVIVLAAFPFILVSDFKRQRETKRHRLEMVSQGRFVRWEEVLQRSNGSHGTLIIETANKMGLRVWWTSDNVRHLTPYPIPVEEEELWFPEAPHRNFVRWLHAQYIDTAEGRGFLTSPEIDLPPGLLRAAYFRERFPELDAIDTLPIAFIETIERHIRK
jgi:hypothetical protein